MEGSFRRPLIPEVPLFLEIALSYQRRSSQKRYAFANWFIVKQFHHFNKQRLLHPENACEQGRRQIQWGYEKTRKKKHHY